MIDHIIISLKQNTLIDRAYVKFSLTGKDNFDELDAVKRKNGYFSLSTLSLDSISLAINNLTSSFCDRNIAVAIDDLKPGTYSLVFQGTIFEDAKTKITLLDRFNNSQAELHSNTIYNFQVTSDPKSYQRKRFVIQMPSSTMVQPVISVEDNHLVSNATAGNQWLLNGQEISGATSTTFEPTITGEYRVKITQNGCSRISEPVSFTVTDLNESQNKGIHLYPNPASERLIVQSEIAFPAPVSYILINSVGLEVEKGAINPKVLQQGAEIDLSKCPAGMYFLILRNDHMSHKTKFLIR
jgi:hypothetical protein